MIKSESNTTVRYSEVDQLGIVYYSRYLEYFEMGRICWINKHLLSYNEIENKLKIGMPAVESFIKYISPARFGETIKIITWVKEKPKGTIKFDYELFIEDKLISVGHTKNAFIDLIKFKPCRPSQLMLKFEKLFSK